MAMLESEDVRSLVVELLSSVSRDTAGELTRLFVLRVIPMDRKNPCF
jgi:hypothetical protein